MENKYWILIMIAMVSASGVLIYSFASNNSYKVGYLEGYNSRVINYEDIISKMNSEINSMKNSIDLYKKTIENNFKSISMLNSKITVLEKPTGQYKVRIWHGDYMNMVSRSYYIGIDYFGNNSKFMWLDLGVNSGIITSIDFYSNSGFLDGNRIYIKNSNSEYNIAIIKLYYESITGGPCMIVPALYYSDVDVIFYLNGDPYGNAIKWIP